MRVRSWLVVAVVASFLWEAQGRAAYVLTPTSGGGSSKDVAPGGSFSVQMDLSGAEMCDAVIFDVAFSQSGLKCCQTRCR
jgi:hypothetical protein